MFLISLLLQAHAGPLADGVRGNAWGSAFSLGAPPQDAGCRASLGASTNSWACQEHLAGTESLDAGGHPCGPREASETLAMLAACEAHERACTAEVQP